MTDPGADSDALAFARVRARGVQRHEAGLCKPAGMLGLAEADGLTAWWVPATPDAVTPAVLRELGLEPPTVAKPGVTCEVMACCLRLCWVDVSAAPWPGIPTSVAAVTDVRTALRPTHRWEKLRDGVTEAVRRLSQSGWLLYSHDTGVIRLGPRVALWTHTDLDQLAELCRTVPDGASEALG